MPVGTKVFDDPEPVKVGIEVVNHDVYYTDSSGQKYLLLGVHAKEID